MLEDLYKHVKITKLELSRAGCGDPGVRWVKEGSCTHYSIEGSRIHLSIVCFADSFTQAVANSDECRCAGLSAHADSCKLYANCKK